MRNDLQHEHYLGDGVYAGWDGYQIWLYLVNDRRPASEGIALEPAVLAALNRYAEIHLPAKLEAERRAGEAVG